MNARHEDAVAIKVTESREVPLLSVVFGYGPMLPFVAGGVAVWLLPAGLRPVVEQATLLWGCAIMTFLAGVRRGVSFRTMGGPTRVQIATMFVVFCIGLGALFGQAFGWRLAPETALAVGYAGLAVLDPIAARRGEVPLFFAKLRPTQLPIAALGLASLIAHRMLV